MHFPDAQRLRGLVAATHTPFHPDGSLHLEVVERQATYLVEKGVKTVFIGGTTGESSSLTVAERLALAQRWMEVVGGSELRVVVHVGANCLADARALAEQAQKLGAAAIAALAPCYFKPRSVEDLVNCMAEIASAAPETPFYHYDIPLLTGVALPMPAFLAQAQARIPTLVGLKFTNSDLVAYNECLHADDGKWDVPFGFDEIMLSALVLGARGAVGSSFNFAAPIYLRLMAAFDRGDLATAREEQWNSVQVVNLLASYGYMGAAKATMKMLGVDVGPARLPNTSLSPGQAAKLEEQLEKLGFFDLVE